VKTIVDYPTPKNGKELHSFLGMVNWLRRHTRYAAELTQCLEAMKMKPKEEFEWTLEMQQAFEATKQAMASCPMLYHPDFTRTFHLACDASNVGVGAYLFQFDDEGRQRIVAYCSRILTKHERNYSTTKKELLAVKVALQKFHPWVYGRRIVVYTDHRALVYLFSQRGANAMVNTWYEVLTDYDFEVVHIPGYKNVVPDTLSRQFYSRTWGVEERQESDAEQRARMSPHDVLVHQTGVDYQDNPSARDEQLQAMEDVHRFGHFGRDATTAKLREKGFRWHGMSRDIAKECSECMECLKFKVAAIEYHPPRSSAHKADQPFDRCAVDLLSLPLAVNGMTTLLVYTDVMSKFVVLRPIVDKTQSTVAMTLWSIFADFGVPKVMQSDNGPEFVNEIIKTIHQLYQIEHRRIIAYLPRANGQVERMNRVILEVLRRTLQGHLDQWVLHIPYVQLAINTKVSSTTGYTPFEVVYGRVLNEWGNYKSTTPYVHQDAILEEWLRSRANATKLLWPIVKKNLRDQAAKSAKAFRQGRRITAKLLQPGTMVMLKALAKDNKLGEEYVGLFKVVGPGRRIGTYTIANRLGELFPHDIVRDRLKVTTKCDFDDAGETHEVEAVINHRGLDDGSYEYLVQWKGLETSTWIPYENFHSQEPVMTYWRRRQPNAKLDATKRTVVIPSEDEHEFIPRGARATTPWTEPMRTRARAKRSLDEEVADSNQKPSKRAPVVQVSQGSLNKGGVLLQERPPASDGGKYSQKTPGFSERKS